MEQSQQNQSFTLPRLQEVIGSAIQPTAQSETTSEVTPETRQTDLPTFKGENFTDFELEALAKMVWAEARGEDGLGQQLVVHAILNRLISGENFPDTLLGVLFQPNQFSPVTDGSFNRATPCQRIHQNITTAIQNHAIKVGNTIAQDPAKGATFFRSKVGAEGSWHERNLTRLFAHGNHIFYN
jgi:N-acetylmuramoyl-L-alanine amidase